MQLKENDGIDINYIKHIDSQELLIGDEKFQESCIVTNKTIHINIKITDILQLSPLHIEQLLASSPEIIIIGSGLNHEFPKIELLNPIAINNIGFEVMNNQSAARTYNVLVSEERQVACLLII